MKISNRRLYEFLKFNGLENLYYSSNVSTAKELIKVGGFISNKQARDMEVPHPLYHNQSFYDEFDIDEDIFFNTFDYHDFYGRPNYFGNVEFIVSIEILLDDDVPSMAITKNNPFYWNRANKNNEYFQSMEEYVDRFYSGITNIAIYQQMCYTFKHCPNVIPFKTYLNGIVIDNPDYIIDRKSVFIYPFKVLKRTVRKYGLKVPLTERQCPQNCMCKSFYYGMMEEDEILSLYRT